jgi:hypothetical protein
VSSRVKRAQQNGEIRDRIVELRRLLARDLVPNPRNWRRHPKAQAAALRGLLAEVGYADALLGRELPDGRVMLIDGHLRAETTPDQAVPVLILDVDEDEANKILATLDPLAGMAETDKGRGVGTCRYAPDRELRRSGSVGFNGWPTINRRDAG